MTTSGRYGNRKVKRVKMGKKQLTLAHSTCSKPCSSHRKRFPTLSTRLRRLDLRSETLTKAGGLAANSRIKFPRTPARMQQVKTTDINKPRGAATDAAMFENGWKEANTRNGNAIRLQLPPNRETT